MKSTVLNLVSLKLAIAGMILTGLFLFAPSQAQAQTFNDFYAAPNGPYTTPANAITRVEAKILTIKGLYEILDPHSQEYKNNAVKYSFYDAILAKLQAGKTVKESLETGLQVFSLDSSGDLSKGKREEYKQEAIYLLKP